MFRVWIPGHSFLMFLICSLNATLVLHILLARWNKAFTHTNFMEHRIWLWKCVFSCVRWFVIDACMIFLNLNVKKMDITIKKIIYCKFDIFIKGILCLFPSLKARCGQHLTFILLVKSSRIKLCYHDFVLVYRNVQR